MEKLIKIAALFISPGYTFTTEAELSNID